MTPIVRLRRWHQTGRPGTMWHLQLIRRDGGQSYVTPDLGPGDQPPDMAKVRRVLARMWRRPA